MSRPYDSLALANCTTSTLTPADIQLSMPKVKVFNTFAKKSLEIASRKSCISFGRRSFNLTAIFYHSVVSWANTSIAKCVKINVGFYRLRRLCALT